MNTYLPQPRRSLEGLLMSPPKRKCFVSYYAGDTLEVSNFIRDFGDAFIPKVIGVGDGDDYINSADTEYVMSRIRANQLGDSTVTICLVGQCTHSRRYIDWEIKSSLRQGSYTPNGLLAILLPSMGGSGHLPERILANWNANDEESGYALFRSYPQSVADLRGWIENAFSRRATHSQRIVNSQEMLRYNRSCRIHRQTH